MSRDKGAVVGIGVALMFAAVFATRASAAGSDVVHYPPAEAYRKTALEDRFAVGVPAPRVRAFVGARWSDARSHQPL